MKRILITLSFSICTILSNAQNTYEKQIREITIELSKKIGESGKKRIAVSDFKDLGGNITNFGSFIAEEFNTSLPEAGQGFEVIDRSRINILIKENKLEDMTDPLTAIKLGKLASIDALVYGTVTPFGESVRLNLKILDLQRGVVLRALVGNITRTADINRLLSETVVDTPTDDPIICPPPVDKKSSEDCKQKNTCTLCVTNKQNLSIEVNANFYNQDINYDKPKLIHTGKTECWQNIIVGLNSEDYRVFDLNISRNNNQIKYERLTIEACKVHTYELQN